MSPVIIKKCEEDVNKNMSPLLRECLSLITTLCNEVPDLVKTFVELGLVEAYLKRFIQNIPVNKMLYLLTFFVAVIRRNDHGAKLLEKYKILSEIFKLFLQKEHAFKFQDNKIMTKLAIELKRYMNYDAVIGTETVENIIKTLL